MQAKDYQVSAGHTGTHEERKRALLRDGEFYRAGVAHSRAQIKHAARPEVIFHSVLDHATWALRSRADLLLKPTGTSMSALAPYALTVLGFIRRRKLGKQALAASIVLGAIGWYVQRKRAQHVSN
jgi:hypothetical protein